MNGAQGWQWAKYALPAGGGDWCLPVEPPLEPLPTLPFFPSDVLVHGAVDGDWLAQKDDNNIFIYRRCRPTGPQIAIPCEDLPLVCKWASTQFALFLFPAFLRSTKRAMLEERSGSGNPGPAEVCPPQRPRGHPAVQLPAPGATRLELAP